MIIVEILKSGLCVCQKGGIMGLTPMDIQNKEFARSFRVTSKKK